MLMKRNGVIRIRCETWHGTTDEHRRKKEGQEGEKGASCGCDEDDRASPKSVNTPPPRLSAEANTKMRLTHSGGWPAFHDHRAAHTPPLRLSEVSGKKMNLVSRPI